MARTRGRRTQYFYAERLKDLLKRVKDGEAFSFFSLTRGTIYKDAFFSKGKLSTEAK